MAEAMENYTQVNADTISRWAEDGWEWGTPVTPEDCARARRGDWAVVLTPLRPVPPEWFLKFDGCRILGLASGGGQQMPIFSVLGADCTVMDLSDKQLESERTVAAREGYAIEIVKADMTKPFPFPDGVFDLIFHPVSNCYIEDVHHVWHECFRVLRPGGVLLAGLDNGINYVFPDAEPGKPLIVTEKLPYNPLKNPAELQAALSRDEGIQFSHTFDEQIGGQLAAGFVITAAYEDNHNVPDWPTVQWGIPTFWATRAVKPMPQG
jgi:SAM-dependent methyltransferase